MGKLSNVLLAIAKTHTALQRALHSVLSAYILYSVTDL